MKSSASLQALYAEWRRLTEAEGEAVRSAAWDRVAEIQAAKSALRQPICEADLAHRETAARRPVPDLETETLRRQITGLVAMERANLVNIRARLAEARQERATLERSVSNLRRIHRSYAPGQAGLWQSYS